MSTLMMLLLPLLAIALLAAPLVPVYRGVTTGKKAKHSVIFNLCAFAGICLIAMIIPFGGMASASVSYTHLST